MANYRSGTDSQTYKHGYCLGYKVTLEYRRWADAKNRCTNPNNHAWIRYGGRGITMCDRWLNSFPNFLEDMGPCPPGLTIDRIDNNKGYSPENCRWATKSQQAFNRNPYQLLIPLAMAKEIAAGLKIGTRKSGLRAWGRKLGVRHSLIRYALRRYGLVK